jgi:predicted RNA-binding protein Jag
VYDPRNEAHEFIADEREAAVAKATQFFGVDADALIVKEYEGSEVSGLAGRTLVVAVPRNRKPVQEGRSARDRDDRGDRGGRERGGRDRGPRSDRDRGGRPDRDRDRGGRGERGERGRRSRESAPRRAELSSEPSVGTAHGALSEPGTFVLGMIERLGLGPFEISETEDGELLVYEIRGEAARALAGGDGRPVDAMQLIANQVAMRLEEDAKRIVLDVEGNAEAREQFLSRLAERVVRRARDGGRAIALDPMSGRDRRIIHIAVRECEGMATMSIGEGRYRQVVIVPEGAPEYAEALQQVEAAQQDY